MRFCIKQFVYENMLFCTGSLGAVKLGRNISMRERV